MCYWLSLFYYAEQIAFETFHKNKKFARGYMAKYYIGDVVEEEREVCSQIFMLIMQPVISE